MADISGIGSSMPAGLGRLGLSLARDPENEVFVDDIQVPVADRTVLAGTLFLPRTSPKTHAVLICSATAVPRKIYRTFANYLAENGCVVLTFDYRGIGGSRPKSLRGFKATMTDWATLDAAAAVTWLRGRYVGLPLSVVGHSFGGQAVGLLPNNTMIGRSLLIAAQAGHWRLMPSPESYRVYAMLNLLGKPVTRLLGFTPGKLGIGEDLPKDVFLQWAGWVMKSRYYFDDPSLAALANYTNYKGAVRALRFTDDPWATQPMVELLCSGFTATKPEIVSIDPKAHGAERIGHFGFFKPEHKETLWKEAANWLKATSGSG